MIIFRVSNCTASTLAFSWLWSKSLIGSKMLFRMLFLQSYQNCSLAQLFIVTIPLFDFYPVSLIIFVRDNERNLGQKPPKGVTKFSEIEKIRHISRGPILRIRDIFYGTQRDVVFSKVERFLKLFWEGARELGPAKVFMSQKRKMSFFGPSKKMS